MKILSIVALLLLNSLLCSAQKDQKTDPRFQKYMDKVAAANGASSTARPEQPQANHFYKTYADFLSGNPVPDVLLSGGRTEILGAVSYEVSINNEIKKMKVSELATNYWGFCDKYGALFRLYKKDAYMVIIAGTITQYVKTGECTGTLKNDSTFALLFGMNGQGGYKDYASIGPNGEIEDLNANLSGKSKTLEEMMAPHPEIYQELLADKDKTKYIGAKYRDRENLTFKIQHYIRKYNNL